MWPLAVCSVIATAIIIERLIWGPRQSNTIPSALVEQLKILLNENRFEELTGLCSGNTSALARIVHTALMFKGKRRVEITEAVELAGRKEACRLTKNLNTLSTIAAIAPLLGLLGTVFGMIKTFNAVQIQGVGNPQILAGGISEALLTTAVGLSIAIPSSVASRYFNLKSQELLLEIEQLALTIINTICAQDSSLVEAQNSQQAGNRLQ